ncbi:TniQ family protein [Janthinobacterium sp. Mn2066]|uniref:TniQ family protein n=1 Tax=Janthinobacterium sp. Mn2066 TaxID=3395264 RepID=UPI003BCB07E9
MNIDDYSVVERVKLPARLTLYKLAPAVFKGATRESLASYFQRLADAHAISPHLLAREVVTPLLGVARRQVSGIDDTWKTSYFHNIGTVAENWSNALNQLTGHRKLQELTFLPLRGMVPTTLLTSLHRKWCPCCLGEDAKSGTPYGRLLWEVRAVEACPIHRVQLVSGCDCAGEASLHCSQAKYLPNICERCGTDLGTQRKLLPAADSQIIKAQLVHDFLDTPYSTTGLPVIKFSEFIWNACQKHADGQYAPFAKMIGKSKSVVHGWLNENRIPPFAEVVNLAYVLGCEVADIFTGEMRRLLDIPRDCTPAQKRQQAQKLNIHAISAQLGRFAAETPCISVEEAARRIGVNKRTLYASFAEQAVIPPFLERAKSRG